MTDLFTRYLSSAAAFSPEGEGGASAPSGTPSGGTSEPSVAPGGSESADATNSADDTFSGFDDNTSDDELDSVDLGAETSPSPEPAPQGQPVQGTPPVPAPVAAPVEAPKTPVAPVEAPSPKEGSAPPPSEIESLVQSIDSNAPALAEWLAQNQFALSKEEAEAFELDAVGNVPKLMAKVAVNNMKSTMNMIKTLVPQLIAAEVGKISTTQAKSKEALSEFYSAHPHLSEKDHGQLVDKWAKSFRAANPKASRKEAIDFVGRAVAVEAGVAPGSAPAAPRAAPFAPARPGARQPVVTNNENVNPFAGLGGDFDE